MGARGVQGWFHPRKWNFQIPQPERVMNLNLSPLQSAVLLKEQAIR